MAKASGQFEDTWYPRIGEDAAEKLRRSRRAIWFLPLGLVFAGAAGVLIGRSSLCDVVGWVLATVAVVCCVMLNVSRWSTAAAISEWYGVKRMRALPSMRPEHFDKWRLAKGFKTPDERAAEPRSASSP